MKIRSMVVVAAVCGGTLAVAGCGGSTSSGANATPVAVATPTPAPSPTPTPVASEPSHTPTPPPCTQGLCEEPTTNTAAPVRLTIRVYKVEDPNGKLVNGFITEFPVGYKVTIDATAKDVDNRDTLGSTDVDFGVSDESLVRIGGNHNFQRKITAVRPGGLQVWASLDGVESNILDLTFKN
jgi:hypothetical protein